jgi:hypothetical protein
MHRHSIVVDGESEEILQSTPASNSQQQPGKGGCRMYAMQGMVYGGWSSDGCLKGRAATEHNNYLQAVTLFAVLSVVDDG